MILRNSVVIRNLMLMALLIGLGGLGSAIFATTSGDCSNQKSACNNVASQGYQTCTGNCGGNSATRDSQPPSIRFSTRAPDQPTSQFIGIAQIQGLAAAFEVIANHLSLSSGPKSLIWFASSFPDIFETTSTRKTSAGGHNLTFLRAFNELLSKDVALYPSS